MAVRILLGDCRTVLKTLPDDSVHCCVTSPPYWGLRSYLPESHPNKPLEIGSEPTLQEWVDTMVAVFREVRRVLRPDGTLWLNLGDAYASRPNGSIGTSGLEGSTAPHAEVRRAHSLRKGAPPIGLKSKDMMGQPWRVAFALQADGWWLRQEIIWAKPNPMPESTRDRCTKAHEHVFLLSKSERYFYDFDAMQEPVNGDAHARRANPEAQGQKRPGFGHGYDEKAKPRYKTPAGWADGDTPHTATAHQTAAHHRKVAAVGRHDGPPGNPPEHTTQAFERPTTRASKNMGREAGWREKSKYGELTGQNADGLHRTKAGLNLPGAGTKNNPSMDEALAEVRDTRNPRSVWTIPTHPFKGAHFATFPPALAERCITAGCPIDGVVLDPFGGSGTVGLVADRQHKNAILIDLDERNVPMATERIVGESPLFANVQQ